MALRRGYAVATFLYGDIEEDHFDGWKNGLRGNLIGRTDAPRRRPMSGARSVGMSRALDYLETNKKVDARRVAVMGHWRHGKAALSAGAQDERSGLVISNNSGDWGQYLAFADRHFHPPGP